MKKKIKICFRLIMIFMIIIGIVNAYMISSTKSKIIENHHKASMIVVLGCGIWGNSPSPMLKDRLDEAYRLYDKNISHTILLTGDVHENYDEISVMKEYLVNLGVDHNHIIEDGKGYSTYESMKNIYDLGYDDIIVVSQQYHLYRAIYIANSLGLNVQGSKAYDITYSGQLYREIREVIARCKDFIKTI